MTDIEYLIGFKKNDNGAIESFYRANRDKFFSYFRFHFNKDADYMADLYSDSCVAIWRNVQQGKLSESGLRSSLSTYLIAIGKNTMKSQDRRHKVVPVEDEGLLDGFVGIARDEDDPQEREALFEYVYKTAREMNPPCSEILPAYYWDKLSMKEIADKFNYSSDSSAKVQMFKCRKKIRSLVDSFLSK